MKNSTTNHANKHEQEETTNDTNSTNKMETTNNTNIIYKDECYRINQAIFKVHNNLGSGFLESVYQEALEIELEAAGIPFESQKLIQIFYNEKPLKQYFKADIVCFNKILLELKAISKINNEHKAQLMNYLTATKMKLGLIINFGTHPKVEICRIAL